MKQNRFYSIVCQCGHWMVTDEPLRALRPSHGHCPQCSGTMYSTVPTIKQSRDSAAAEGQRRSLAVLAQ